MPVTNARSGGGHGPHAAARGERRGAGVYVADSGLYSDREHARAQCRRRCWVSRVPETSADGAGASCAKNQAAGSRAPTGAGSGGAG